MLQHLFFISLISIASCRTPSEEDRDLRLEKAKASNCGGTCAGPQDCSGICASCRLGICVGAGNCNDYCDPVKGVLFYCYNDYCQYCDNHTLSCRSNCQGPCIKDEQCGGSCSTCFNNACAGSCSAPCQFSNDCLNNPAGCTQCVNNVCSKPTGCDRTCQTNDDCVKNTDGCTKCVRNKCIPGGCNSKCYYTPDCFQQGNCTQCMGRFDPPDNYGVCTAVCGGGCTSNAQCNGTLTNCGLCSNGKCVPSDVCGVTCMNDVGCAGNCHRCINGKCTKNGTCGEACQVNDQCDQTNPSCMFCINQKCGAP